MFFGSARTTKATAAAEAAALAAWRTVDRGDRVGAILFDDEEFVEIKPQRSRGNVLRICHEARAAQRPIVRGSAEPPSRRVLNDALRRAANVARHDHLVILITDYDGDDETTRELTTRLAAHNDVLAVLDLRSARCQIPERRRHGGDRRPAAGCRSRTADRFARAV